MKHNGYEFPLGIDTGPVGFCFKPLSHNKPIEKPLCSCVLFHNKNPIEELLGANGIWLGAFGSLEKIYHNLKHFFLKEYLLTPFVLISQKYVTVLVLILHFDTAF